VSPRIDIPAIARRIDALSAELPQSTDADLANKIDAVSKTLLTARLDILRNIRPPISPAETSGLETLLISVADFLSLSSISERLPASSHSLVTESYKLLDQASQYKALAGHFFNRSVQAARRERTSDAVDLEVEAVSHKASDLKDKIIEQIDRVCEELKPLARP
jgi:hypothetical protein